MMSTEMINRIICFITQTMGMMVLVLCLDRLLTGRKGISRGKRLFFWFVLASVGAGIKVFLTTGNMSYPVMAIHQIYTLIVITAILKYCYQDKFSVKIIHFVMLMLQNILGDVIGQIFLGLETWELTEMSFTDRMMAENSIAANMCSVIFNLGYTAVALAVKKKKKILPGPMWLMLMLQSLTIFSGIVIMRRMLLTEKTGMSYVLYCLLSTVLVSAILSVYLSQSEKWDVKEELGRLQQVMELEKLHYEQIEARREEMAKLRHDYNNILTSILFLMKNGRNSEAEHMVEELSKRMEATREYPFCPIPIINAILSEKKNECEEVGILLTADLKIPSISRIDDLDWCMIFGNLMDNAIRACKELLADGRKKPEIVLSGGLVQNYLVIKCQNETFEDIEKRISGTGYGHKILADIAEKYHGNFLIFNENGVYKTQISLLSTQQENISRN